MSNYFDDSGLIFFQCDNCGRRLNSVNYYNGMNFCAKCYQETFGETDKDRKIADLEAKLAESEKQRKHLKDCLDDEILTSINHESYYSTINEYEEEINQLKQQLAEKDQTITTLIEDSKASKELLKKEIAEKDDELEKWSTQYARAYVNRQNDLIAEKEQLKQQLAEKEKDIKWLTEEYNKERHRANEIADTAMKHNYDMAIQQLQRVKEEMHRGLEFDYDLDIWATEFINEIIAELKQEEE